MLHTGGIKAKRKVRSTVGSIIMLQAWSAHGNVIIVWDAILGLCSTSSSYSLDLSLRCFGGGTFSGWVPVGTESRRMGRAVSSIAQRFRE
jgi:hypothetical protein